MFVRQLETALRSNALIGSMALENIDIYRRPLRTVGSKALKDSDTLRRPLRTVGSKALEDSDTSRRRRRLAAVSAQVKPRKLPVNSTAAPVNSTARLIKFSSGRAA
eukprot:8855410-Pyramimonas_sp.AAC.3